MLILSRKKGEKVIIDDGDKRITVTVLEFRGNRVRIGVEAPEDVQIWRGELKDLIQNDHASNEEQNPT